MAEITNIKSILQVLYTKVLGVSSNVYITNRPTSVETSMSDFVVVAVPGAIKNKAYGYDGYSASTYGRITLFARDNKNGAQNINKLQTMIDAALAIFPISENGIQCSRPSVIDTGSDDNGFHTMSIQFSILIY